ncbi:MAG: helix-turn-helix domain-containing protein [Acidobacteriota bacterium]
MSLRPEHMGRGLSLLLRRRGLTQTEAIRRARALGARISAPTLSNWVNGEAEPKSYNLLTLLQAIGADLCDLQGAMEDVAREHPPRPREVTAVIENLRHRVEGDPESRRALRGILDTLGQQTDALKDLSARLDALESNRGNASAVGE